MTDVIVIAILAVIIGAAVAYIVRARKRGACIGCPDSSKCGGNCSGCGGCGRCHAENKSR